MGYGFENYYTKDERDALGVEAARILDEKAVALKKGALDRPFLLVASFLNPHDICLESSTGLSPIVEDKGGRKQVITECVRQMRARAAAIDSVDFYKKYAPALPFNFAKTTAYPAEKKSPSKDFPEYYWRKYRWTYGQLVSLVDSHIGHIVDALDRNPELKKNTVIIFTSDHGEMQGAHQMVTKGVPYEECQRVPFVFCGPGIKAGTRDNSLVCNGWICSLLFVNWQILKHLTLMEYLWHSVSKGREKGVLRSKLYVEGQGFLTVIDDKVKYTLFDGMGGGEMLINLHADNGELQNIFSGNEASAAKLRAFIPMDKLEVVSIKGNKKGGEKMKPKNKKEESG